MGGGTSMRREANSPGVRGVAAFVEAERRVEGGRRASILGRWRVKERVKAMLFRIRIFKSHEGLKERRVKDRVKAKYRTSLPLALHRQQHPCASPWPQVSSLSTSPSPPSASPSTTRWHRSPLSQSRPAATARLQAPREAALQSRVATRSASFLRRDETALIE